MLLLKSAANREHNSWDIKPIRQICPIQDPGDKWSNIVFLKVDQSIDRPVIISQWCQTSDEILLFNNWAISSDNGTFNPPYITFLTLYTVTCHEYGRCSKIPNTSCLLERPRQTVQTQIRVITVSYSDKILWIATLTNNILFDPRKRKEH